MGKRIRTVVMLDAWHDVRAMWPHATSGTDASERFGPAVHRCWAILWPGRKDSQLKSMFEMNLPLMSPVRLAEL